MFTHYIELKKDCEKIIQKGYDQGLNSEEISKQIDDYYKEWMQRQSDKESM